jgi:hypothetical protein
MTWNSCGERMANPLSGDGLNCCLCSFNWRVVIPLFFVVVNKLICMVGWGIVFQLTAFLHCSKIVFFFIFGLFLIWMWSSVQMISDTIIIVKIVSSNSGTHKKILIFKKYISDLTSNLHRPYKKIERGFLMRFVRCLRSHVFFRQKRWQKMCW